MLFNIPSKYTEDGIYRDGSDVVEGRYYRDEIDRSIDSLQAEFWRSFGIRLTSQFHRIYDEQGYLSVLDAGCGTGRELYDLMEECQGLPRVRAVGVSDIDFSAESRLWRVRSAMATGDIGYAVADLETVDLPADSFNFIISYELLVHTLSPSSVVANMIQSLSGGGLMFFNADIDQKADIDQSIKNMGISGGAVRSAASVPPYAQVLSGGDAGRVNYIISKMGSK